jgi:hypothetical protein
MSDFEGYEIELKGLGGGEISFTMKDPEPIKAWRAFAEGDIGSNRAYVSWTEEEEGGTEIDIFFEFGVGTVTVCSSIQSSLVRVSFLITVEDAQEQLSKCLS